MYVHERLCQLTSQQDSAGEEKPQRKTATLNYRPPKTQAEVFSEQRAGCQLCPWGTGTSIGNSSTLLLIAVVDAELSSAVFTLLL